jgi:cell division protein FtsB
VKHPFASRGEWVRALGLGTAAIVILGVSALLDHESGFGIWLELGKDLARSEARVGELLRRNDAMRREIDMLEAEPAAIDRAIREELDLALPGEIIVRFVNSDAKDILEGKPEGGPQALQYLFGNRLFYREAR